MGKLLLLPRTWLWCVAILLVACSSLSGAQEEEVVPECPAYRHFTKEFTDYWTDYTPIGELEKQYLAPSGCQCVDGMTDMHCKYCETDQGCQTENSNHVCRTGTVFHENDTYKSYRCALTGTIEDMFVGGKLSIYVDMAAKSAHLSVYNWEFSEPINGDHVIDCDLTGCDIPIGGASGSCTRTVCKCTKHCSEFSRGIIEDVISGKPSNFYIDNTEGGEAHVAVVIEGSPFDIEAMCNASTCSEEPVVEVDETIIVEREDTSGVGLGWTASSRLALFILLVISGIFVLMTIAVSVPYLMTQKHVPPPTSSSKRTTKRKSMDESTTDLNRSADISDGNVAEEEGGPAKQVLEFRHISKVVRLRPDAAKKNGHPDKMILNNISGRVESGTLMAIMGPSGSGKSSLLNILAAVETQGVSRVSGQILLNGVLQKKGYRTQVAYVQQDDALYSTLTVRECVEYSALLRLPRGMTASEKQTQVWQTLEELRLTDVADNRIGSTGGNGTAGISGGERKRVSIGMELVAKAPVLVLDEPTSGLDAYGANQLVKVLSELSTRGNRIVILSIHQPSMKSFMTMDQILLLGHGRAMYRGKPEDVGDYLYDYGFPCPPLETVADHMLNVVSDRNNQEILKCGDATPNSYAKLCLEKAPESLISPTASTIFSTNYSEDDGVNTEEWDMKRGSRLNEIAVLFARTAKDIFRNKELFLMQLIISFVLALFAGGIFNDVSNNLAGFQNRMGAFYFCLSFFAFASFSSMDIFVRERHIFVRETGSKYYQASSYFLAKTVLDIFVLRVIPVTIFGFVFYWMMGLKNDPAAFVTFLCTIVLFNVCAGTMSICISIATPTVGQANLIAAVWFLVMLLFGGFLVNIQSMPPWFAWLKYLSIFYYSFETLMTNELAGLQLSFDAPGYPALPVMGEIFLSTIGMEISNQSRNLICMCALVLCCCFVAYLLLLVRVPPKAKILFNKMQKENRRLAMTLTKRPSVAQRRKSQQLGASNRILVSQRDLSEQVSRSSRDSQADPTEQTINSSSQRDDLADRILVTEGSQSQNWELQRFDTSTSSEIFET